MVIYYINMNDKDSCQSQKLPTSHYASPFLPNELF